MSTVSRHDNADGDDDDDDDDGTDDIGDDNVDTEYPLDNIDEVGIYKDAGSQTVHGDDDDVDEGW